MEWYDSQVVRNMQAERQSLQAALAVSRESGDVQINDLLRRLRILHDIARLDDMQAAFDAPVPF